MPCAKLHALLVGLRWMLLILQTINHFKTKLLVDLQQKHSLHTCRTALKLSHRSGFISHDTYSGKSAASLTTVAPRHESSNILCMMLSLLCLIPWALQQQGVYWSHEMTNSQSLIKLFSWRVAGIGIDSVLEHCNRQGPVKLFVFCVCLKVRCVAL